MSTTTEVAEIPTAAVPIAHPLADKDIESFGTWKQWRTAWDETKDPKRLLGLLQFGFDVSSETDDEASERVRFYLDLADKYNSVENFGERDECFEFGTDPLPCKMSLRQRKRFISRKAFDVLCTRFFRNTNGPNEPPSWARLVTMPEAFEKLLWFLRPDEWNTSIPNLSDIGHKHESSRHLQVATEFAYALWKFSFEQMISDRRPELTCLVVGLGREGDLLQEDLPVESAEIAELERIVLRRVLWDGENHRRPKTVEEACALGSRPARTLLQLRVIVKECARLAKIRELKRTKAETDREIQNLQ
ncbi:MAG: hypothetical protein Q7S84_02810 [bacterium]|nr:hypothetical protein [bacterium]